MQGSFGRSETSDAASSSEGVARLDERAVEVLSHELRSPITTIHLGAKVLRSAEVRPPVREAVLEAVDIEAERLLRVVEDLLAVIRHEAGSRLRVEPLLLQRRLADLLGEQRLEPGMRLRVFVPDDLPAVMADDAALGQVVRNLVVNALHHGASAQPTEIVAAAGPAGFVTLQVLDRGPGIPEDDTERVFEPFYRCPGSGVTGAGLGLAAAQRLALAMGGRISVSARAGGGTVASVALRMAESGE
jgi:two-component system sensor histidine kinase KdpD